MKFELDGAVFYLKTDTDGRASDPIQDFPTTLPDMVYRWKTCISRNC